LYCSEFLIARFRLCYIPFWSVRSCYPVKMFFWHCTAPQMISSHQCCSSLSTDLHLNWQLPNSRYSASEVTILWRYKNQFIIIIIYYNSRALTYLVEYCWQTDDCDCRLRCADCGDVDSCGLVHIWSTIMFLCRVAYIMAYRTICQQTDSRSVRLRTGQQQIFLITERLYLHTKPKPSHNVNQRQLLKVFNCVKLPQSTSVVIIYCKV